MVELTDQPLDTSQILAQMGSPTCGATVLFLGTTRRITDAKETQMLTYSAYAPMARHQMERLERQARSRWPVEKCILVHRLGEVPVGEASVAVAVATPHRRDAFEAANWLIDALKQLVPVWKKEHWSSGGQEWVHPGLSPAAKEKNDTMHS